MHTHGLFNLPLHCRILQGHQDSRYTSQPGRHACRYPFHCIWVLGVFYALRPLLISTGLTDQGFGIFTASIVLAIMIVPYATSLSSEIIAMVPSELKEAAYSLGATRREVIFSVVIPSARSGIVASFILALGRALGETMAVTMLIGNANIIPKGLFSPGNTMASVIANQFGEADGLKLECTHSNRAAALCHHGTGQCSR
ncbi:MAG: ABC transporter permease subunit [Marinilabiliales bacterium]|nr:ABC transporter permease subunit [Marinilabiliales bacterium]